MGHSQSADCLRSGGLSRRGMIFHGAVKGLQGYLPPFWSRETEAQRGEAICPRLHGS